MAVKQPLRYMALLGSTPKVGIIIVVLSWISAIFLWTLINFFYIWFPNAAKEINLATEIFISLVMVAVIAAATIVQFRIFLTVRSTMASDPPNVRRSSATLSQLSTPQWTRKTFYFSVSTLILVVVIWSPYTIYRLLLSIEIVFVGSDNFEKHETVFKVLHAIFSLHSILMPVLYAFRIQQNPVKLFINMFEDFIHAVVNFVERKLAKNNKKTTQQSVSIAMVAIRPHSSQRNFTPPIQGDKTMKRSKSEPVIHTGGATTINSTTISPVRFSVDNNYQ